MERKISPQNVPSTNYKSVGKNLLLDYVRVSRTAHQRIAKGLLGDDEWANCDCEKSNIYVITFLTPSKIQVPRSRNYGRKATPSPYCVSPRRLEELPLTLRGLVLFSARALQKRSQVRRLVQTDFKGMTSVVPS
jgi:hypothetical protein